MATDLEKIKLCAAAMGIKVHDILAHLESVAQRDWRILHANGSYSLYDPLHNDAQAMALEDWLVARGCLTQESDRFYFCSWDRIFIFEVKEKLDGPRRRRAIVECVAKMQAEKAK